MGHRSWNRDWTLDSKLEGNNEYYVRNDAKYRMEDGISVEFVWKEDGKREGVCRRRKDDWKKEREWKTFSLMNTRDARTNYIPSSVYPGVLGERSGLEEWSLEGYRQT